MEKVCLKVSCLTGRKLTLCLRKLLNRIALLVESDLVFLFLKVQIVTSLSSQQTLFSLLALLLVALLL